jgi:hypothetical protein
MLYPTSRHFKKRRGGAKSDGLLPTQQNLNKIATQPHKKLTCLIEFIP